MRDLNKLVRPEIQQLKPYTSARDEFSGKGFIYLDANENPYREGINRYPDPFQRNLKKQVAQLYEVNPDNLFLGNGSDEILDLMMRVFCRPGKDNIVTIDPTYGMYEVLANINQLETRKAKLDRNYDLQPDKVLELCDENTKLIILCSPNNPSGNLLNELDVYKIVNTFQGIVLLDEAYIEFSGTSGFYRKISQFSNLVVLRTFSKAWGLAGIRLGYAFADKQILNYMNKVKYPYNVNRLTQKKAMMALKKKRNVQKKIGKIVRERQKLSESLKQLVFVKKIYPSQANFLLVSVANPKEALKYLKEHKLIVRDRSGVTHCGNCIRITVGTKTQNRLLIKALKSYEQLPEFAEEADR